MNKINKYIIVASVILAFIVYPIIVYPDDQSHKDGILKFILRILGDLSIIVLISLLVNVLLSFLLKKNKTYLNRFKSILPSTIFIMLITTSLILLLNKTIKFDEIDVPESLSCVSIKEGEFICQNLEITRREDIQIETDTKTNLIKEYQIRWNTDCEYELIGINSNNQNFKVKIIEVTQESHKAYVSKLNSNSAQLIEMKNK